MLFDKTIVTNSKEIEGKIVKGALRYLVIKESFNCSVPLNKNNLFRTYFINFYGLNRSGFSRQGKFDDLFVFFESCKAKYLSKMMVLPDCFSDIAKGLSGITGNNESSFSSKLLHTINNDSPIIDKNVKNGLMLNKGRRTSLDLYNDLVNIYYNAKSLTVTYKKTGINTYTPINGNGLLSVADNDNWYNNFDAICIGYVREVLNKKRGSYSRKKVIELLKDICIANKCGQENKKIEEIFSKNKEEDLLSEMKNALGIDVFVLIKNISKVKKIDFYLWALFAK